MILINKAMDLNKIQRTVLTITALIIIIMIVFPPTTFTTYNQLDGAAEVFAGYQFIGKLHTWDLKPVLDMDHRTTSSIFNIDKTRLYIQMLGVLLSSFLLVFALHGISFKSEGISKRNKEKSNLKTSQIVGFGLVGLAGIMFIYLIRLLIVEGYEIDLGFLMGYFFIPLAVLISGTFVLYRSWGSKK